MRVAVLGGGISGLSAAYRLKKAGAGVQLFEAGPRAGGSLGTERFDGFEVETGPDSILCEKPWAIELARELGLEDQILRTRPDAHGAYIVHDGALVRVPAGYSLMAPTDIAQFLRNPILSVPGKLRALLDLALPRRVATDDESLEDFVVRRLGRENFARLAQPLIGGIYGADPKQLSLASTMPRFVAMEREHGSVIRGLTKKRDATRSEGARYGMFAAFRGGMQTLIDALERELADVITLNSSIDRVTRAGARFGVESGGVRDEFDGLIVALPAHSAGRVLGELDPQLSRQLGQISYASAVTVTCIWERADVPHALDAYGFVVPAIEGREILASTWASAKWSGRAPEGKVLIRVFIGGHLGQHLVERPDAALLDIATRELAGLMGITARPAWSRVIRYVRAMPQYQLGHAQRVTDLEARAASHAGFALAGNAYRGVGIPDAVKSGADAAARVLSHSP